MEWLSVIILAVIQGITEFLPISSDGHLAVGEALCESLLHVKFTNKLGLTIVLHAGTFVAVLAYYWNRVWRLLGADVHVLGLLIIGTLPAVVTGMLLKVFASHWLESPWLTGWLLLVNAALLWWASHRPLGTLTYQELTWRQALVIGLFQAVAPLPGISRSGSTIGAGLWLGLKREDAATFSFLLSLPAVGGAIILESIDIARTGNPGLPWAILATGAAVSCVVGIFALRWLITWLQRGKLQYFALWCVPMGLAVIAWQYAAAR
jgi:undecaprenyl-diphosphatase